MAYFPMMVDLSNQPVLVIGGGTEGSKKVRVLHSFGAEITLIATDAKEDAVNLSRVFYDRPFRDEDITGKEYAMIVASTDDTQLNCHISELAMKEKIPVNIVDNQELCGFIFPAIFQDQDVVCAVSSGGKSPYVAQYVRDKIREALPENIGEINEKMGTYREAAKREIEDSSKRREFLKEKFNELLSE